MSITLNLPDDIGLHLLEDPAHAGPAVLQEVAIALYQEGKLSPGRAAQVAGLNRWEFEKLITSRQIPFPANAESIQEEVQHALRRR